MTYEEALQIAMEELYDAVEVLRRNNKGYPSRVDLECNRLLTARNVLCKELGEAEEPRREWVGLTGFEIRDTIRGTIEEVTVSQMVYCVAVAKSIEAKLKEKNTP